MEGNNKILTSIKFKKLEIFNLSKNNIKKISILKEVSFTELKKLNLSSNIISDISLLKKLNLIN